MQRILSYMRKAIEEYNMIEENDKIAICLSGGKDSITLLHAFKALQRFYPKKFELIAISINPGFEFFDTTLLQNLCDNLEIPLFIEKTHAKEIVFDIRKKIKFFVKFNCIIFSYKLQKINRSRINLFLLIKINILCS